MKNLLPLIPAIFFLFSCNQTMERPDSEELMIMHKIIERSRPDSVGKYLNYYHQKYDLPYQFTNVSEGNYQGASPYDDFDYKHAIDFTVEDGKVTSVEYDEIHKDGHSKTSDSAYNAEMNANAYGSAPRITYDTYAKQLINKQDIRELDAISGATYSMYRIQYAIVRAVLNGPVEPE